MNWSDDFTYVSHVIQVKKYILTITVCVTFMRDLETEDHVMVHVTFVISVCICPTAKICLLFREVFCLGIHSNY